MILLVKDNGGYVSIKELNKIILAIRDELGSLKREIDNVKLKLETLP